MRRRIWIAMWLVTAVVALSAVWWWYFHGQAAMLARLREIRASGEVLDVEQSCAGHVRGPKDLSVWAAKLDDAWKRISRDESEQSEACFAFGDSPLRVWHDKNHALDDASWTAEGPCLEHDAAQMEEVSTVSLTIGEYEPIDPCSLIEGSKWAGHPDPDLVNPFRAARALVLSMLRAARHGDLDLVQRDVEAVLALAERIYAPVSANYFLEWIYCSSVALGCTECTLALLKDRIDLDALDRRLAAFDPRDLLLRSLDWEETCGLAEFEHSEALLESVPANKLLLSILWDARGDLDRWLEGFDLGRRLVGGEGVTTKDFVAYQERLGPRTFVTAMLMPFIQDAEISARNCEAHLHLARTALHLLQHGRSGWESVPREIDPWTNAPLAAEERSDGRIELRSIGGGLGLPEQIAIKWIVWFP